MPKFTTRVELHDAQPKDYENLHAAMEKKGFSRTITDKDGVVYHLPPAEYNYETTSNLSAADVRDKADAAASSVWKSFGIITTKSESRAWQGLEKQKTAAAVPRRRFI